MRNVTRLFVMGIVLWVAPVMAQEIGPGAGGDAGSDTNMQIFMDKVKADKKLLVAANMDLNDAEGKKFWPLYDGYQKELEQLNQRLGKTIDGYAEAYNQGKGTISNDLAKKLLNEALSVEEAEVKLKRSYADKIGKVLPATKTARYIQIENKIRAIVRIELAKRIPFVTEQKS
ncbi:MAG: hypothetical protein L0H94_00045 [Nitrospira sp.]|nr:hypothetical protein [Nitrospira sp.]